MSCGTFRLTEETGCCGGLRPTSITPPEPPVVPVELLDATTVVQTGIVDKPAGVVDGTLLLVATGSDAAITPPAGFTQVGLTAFFDLAFAGFNWEVALYAKFVVTAGTEPATYDFSTGASWIDVWMLALANVGSIGDTTERPVNPTGTTGTVSNGASVNVLGDGALLVRFEASNTDNRTSGPPGMTLIAGSPLDGTFNADQESVPVGATGDRDSTYAVTQTWAVQMVVLEAA